MVEEPPSQTTRSSRCPNVTLTPHSAGPTWENWTARFRNGFDNIQRVAAGRAPLWVIPELTDLLEVERAGRWGRGRPPPPRAQALLDDLVVDHLDVVADAVAVVADRVLRHARFVLGCEVVAHFFFMSSRVAPSRRRSSPRHQMIRSPSRKNVRWLFGTGSPCPTMTWVMSSFSRGRLPITYGGPRRAPQTPRSAPRRTVALRGRQSARKIRSGVSSESFVRPHSPMLICSSSRMISHTRATPSAPSAARPHSIVRPHATTRRRGPGP